MFVIMEGGFLIPTYVKESTIKGAGKGRFIIGNHKKGSIIRKQEINSETLHVIKNKDELENYNIELLSDRSIISSVSKSKIYKKNDDLYSNSTKNIKEKFDFAFIAFGIIRL